MGERRRAQVSAPAIVWLTMVVRMGALAALVVALLAAAPGASAAGARLVVSPQAPLVGERSTIEVHLVSSRRAAPLVVELLSPTGVPRALPLRRVGSRLWRASYRFPDDGAWTLRVVQRRSVSVHRVVVLQPPALIPPFRPSLLPGTGALDGGLGTGGIAIGPRP